MYRHFFVKCLQVVWFIMPYFESNTKFHLFFSEKEFSLTEIPFHPIILPDTPCSWKGDLMSSLIPGNQKHLTLDNRVFIEKCLDQDMAMKDIAKPLCKDPSTISKEVKKHRTFHPHSMDKSYIILSVINNIINLNTLFFLIYLINQPIMFPQMGRPVFCGEIRKVRYTAIRILFQRINHFIKCIHFLLKIPEIRFPYTNPIFHYISAV